MKKYYAVKGTTNLIFGSRAKRDEYIAANPDYHPEENHVWASDEMRIILGNSDITAETGLEYPLEEAIKRNWERIMRAARYSAYPCRQCSMHSALLSGQSGVQGLCGVT